MDWLPMQLHSPRPSVYLLLLRDTYSTYYSHYAIHDHLLTVLSQSVLTIGERDDRMPLSILYIRRATAMYELVSGGVGSRKVNTFGIGSQKALACY